MSVIMKQYSSVCDLKFLWYGNVDYDFLGYGFVSTCG